MWLTSSLAVCSVASRSCSAASRAKAIASKSSRSFKGASISRTVAEFLGEASYLSGRRENGRIKTAVGEIDADQLVGYDGSHPEILVRPDDLTVKQAADGTGNGTISYRRFNGPSVSYRVTLETGAIVGCTASNDELLDRGTSVTLDLAATHRLRTFSPTE